MPKLKTHSGAAKRLKVTKNKKFKFTKANRRHLLESKSPAKSRQNRKSSYIHDANLYQVKQLLPYA